MSLKSKTGKEGTSEENESMGGRFIFAVWDVHDLPRLGTSGHRHCLAGIDIMEGGVEMDKAMKKEKK